MHVGLNVAFAQDLPGERMQGGLTVEPARDQPSEAEVLRPAIAVVHARSQLFGRKLPNSEADQQTALELQTPELKGLWDGGCQLAPPGCRHALTQALMACLEAPHCTRENK